MGAFVPSEGGFMCEFFSAFIAGIGFLPSVDEHVCLEVLVQGESCVAESAGIGFFPSVGAQVYLEIAFTCVSFATDLMLDGIYYKFANMSLSLLIRITCLSLLIRITCLSLLIRITCLSLLIRITCLSLLIRITYWAIEL